MSTGLAASTVTPGSTAPEGSLTTPVIAACAKSVAGRSRTTNRAAADRRTRVHMDEPPYLHAVVSWGNKRVIKWSKNRHHEHGCQRIRCGFSRGFLRAARSAKASAERAAQRRSASWPRSGRAAIRGRRRLRSADVLRIRRIGTERQALLARRHRDGHAGRHAALDPVEEQRETIPLVGDRRDRECPAVAARAVVRPAQ